MLRRTDSESSFHIFLHYKVAYNIWRRRFVLFRTVGSPIIHLYYLVLLQVSFMGIEREGGGNLCGRKPEIENMLPPALRST